MESSRKNELAHLGAALRWLDGEHARNSYDHALAFTSNDTYGLNSSILLGIERHVIESLGVARCWLSTRIMKDAFTVRVVFGPAEVVVLPTALFLANWPDLFRPGRDDAVVLADRAKWVFFFCHDNELELGHRYPT